MHNYESAVGRLPPSWWDCPSYNGDDALCSMRAAGRLFPITGNLRDTGWKFGSRHQVVVQFGFADGHVQALQDALELLSRRADGQVIAIYDIAMVSRVPRPPLATVCG